jgi:predicted transcriptional regulator
MLTLLIIPIAVIIAIIWTVIDSEQKKQAEIAESLAQLKNDTAREYEVGRRRAEKLAEKLERLNTRIVKEIARKSTDFDARYMLLEELDEIKEEIKHYNPNARIYREIPHEIQWPLIVSIINMRSAIYDSMNDDY